MGEVGRVGAGVRGRAEEGSRGGGRAGHRLAGPCARIALSFPYTRTGRC
jgi:hypothetical protein